MGGGQTGENRDGFRSSTKSRAVKPPDFSKSPRGRAGGPVTSVAPVAPGKGCCDAMLPWRSDDQKNQCPRPGSSLENSGTGLGPMSRLLGSPQRRLPRAQGKGLGGLVIALFLCFCFCFFLFLFFLFFLLYLPFPGWVNLRLFPVPTPKYQPHLHCSLLASLHMNCRSSRLDEPELERYYPLRARYLQGTAGSNEGSPVIRRGSTQINFFFFQKENSGSYIWARDIAHLFLKRDHGQIPSALCSLHARAREEILHSNSRGPGAQMLRGHCSRKGAPFGPAHDIGDDIIGQGRPCPSIDGMGSKWQNGILVKVSRSRRHALLPREQERPVGFR